MRKAYTNTKIVETNPLLNLHQAFVYNRECWLTKDGQTLPWSKVKTSHLNHIIRGLQRGLSFYGQEHKLSRAQEEARKREGNV